MNKFKKNNLFIEINNDEFLIAVGKYDDELNFKIIEMTLEVAQKSPFPQMMKNAC